MSRQYLIRTVAWELGGLRSRREAQWLRGAELECRWHRLYGERMWALECAGCGKPIGGLPSLDFADGNRVHLELGCLIRYGQRWRGAAMRALLSMGLQPPDETDLISSATNAPI